DGIRDFHVTGVQTCALPISDDYERAFHARGQSYHDLIRLRAGDVASAPDLVVYPLADQVQAILAWAQSANVAVVPYGGGSSVVRSEERRVGTGGRRGWSAEQ